MTEPAAGLASAAAFVDTLPGGETAAPPAVDPALAASAALAAAATYSTPGDDANATPDAAPDAEAGGADRQRERRSRDRYGRDRRERGDRAPREGDSAERSPAADGELAAGSANAVAERPAHEGSYFAQRAMQQGATAAAPIAAPVAALAAAPAATPVATPALAAESMPNVAEVPIARSSIAIEKIAVQAPAPAVATPAAPAPRAPVEAAPAATLPRVQAFALPMDELAQVAEGSGLQWVNSDADKIAAVRAAIAAEPAPVRVPRERPPAVVIDASPLVLVETKRDLRNLTLPFEETPAK